MANAYLFLSRKFNSNNYLSQLWSHSILPPSCKLWMLNSLVMKRFVRSHFQISDTYITITITKAISFCYNVLKCGVPNIIGFKLIFLFGSRLTY